MGWIFVQKCVPLCTRVCVRGNECMRGVRAHLRFVHVPPVWLREDEYILLEPAPRHCDQSTQGGRDNASTCATWLHELKERHCVACHWNSNLRVLHILEVLLRYTCIACIRFCNQIMNKYHRQHVSSESYMPDVDLRLILIVHLIQNQLVFIKKGRASWIRRISKRQEQEKHGIVVECHLESYRIVRVFDCAQKKRRILSKRYDCMGCFL